MFRILSLAGGGLRGAFAIGLLEKIEPLNSIGEYKRNLSEFVGKAKVNSNTKNASLLFGLTTPYPAGVTHVRLPEDAVQYNKTPVGVTRDEKVPIVDLYSPVVDQLTTLQKP